MDIQRVVFAVETPTSNPFFFPQTVLVDVKNCLVSEVAEKSQSNNAPSLSDAAYTSLMMEVI